MTMNSRSRSKSDILDSKESRIGRFEIDILAVYRSENETAISFDQALKALKSRFSSQNQGRFNKCIMEIWSKQNLDFRIDIRSKEKKNILESFSLDSVGPPSCSQIGNGRFQTISLVFLPVLNSNYKSELFIFHPIKIPAQSVTIKLVQLIEIRKKVKMSSSNPSVSSDLTNNLNIYQNQNVNDSRKKTTENKISQKERKSNNLEDFSSLCSISSTFINNWFGKLDMVPMLNSNSEAPITNINEEELYLLNQNLKDIRLFMNRISEIVKESIHEKKLRSQGNNKKNDNGLHAKHFPASVQFIDVVQKIKLCLNLAVTHEQLIVNPSSDEIINQLFLFLRILGDATLSSSSGTPNLISNVKEPKITSSTVKYFTSHLNSENLKYWSILGMHFGYLKDREANHLDRTIIDEFEIRRTPLSLDHEQKHLTPLYRYEPKFHQSSQSSSLDQERIYRTFPRVYELEKVTPLFLDTENLEYQPKSAPHSPCSNCYIHSHNSSWDDRQCRFIDTVQLRNGRLGQVVCDRSTTNYFELNVCLNEVVEILKDCGNKYSIKNALGEIGECPKSIIHNFN